MRKLRFVLVSAIVAIVLTLAAVPALGQNQTPASNCTALDYSSVQDKLIKAQDALTGGDLPTSVQLQSEARDELKSLFEGCAVEPILTQGGADQATVDAIKNMPLCQYNFEATVRSGPDVGLNMIGVLSLLQNTDTTAVGYVYSVNSSVAPVPVKAMLGDDLAVTLNFSLPNNATIVGNGYFTSSIKTCFGGIEGIFNGPVQNDVGDWIGNDCTINPSSMSCTPKILIPGGDLPVLNTNPIQKPQQPSGNEGGTQPPPLMCSLVRDAACLAACGDNATCQFKCPVVGSTCS